MPQQVFISHAGADATLAGDVAGTLRRAGIEPVLDRDITRPGSDFMDFMGRALTECDYCLLLWSRAAAAGRWVRLEWEAALHRAITEARRFLVAARLEDHPLPVLLAPRLSVELFPALSPGIDRFISMCGQDRTASEATGRPVGQPTTAVAQDEQGDTVYVTSERFQLTEPVNIVLSAPAGVLLDRLIKQLNLPHHTNLLGAMVTRYEYRLVFNDSRLSRDKSLASQDVRPLAVLQLEVQPNVFGPETPTDGIALPAFRGRFDERERALEEAERAIKIAVQRAGLGY